MIGANQLGLIGKRRHACEKNIKSENDQIRFQTGVLPTWLNFFGPFLSSLDFRERLKILVQLLAGDSVVQPPVYVYTSPLDSDTVQFLPSRASWEWE